ncbi:MAG: hypothetical protein M1830_001134 [Pleopsidium flavum]|nr:MAG: hypothetical protein M1830_001134 [Pleopsidium flavum]
MSWFGSLQLAYKYAIVFASLLIVTLTAGVIKVFLNRRKLQKHTEEANLEAAGKKEEQHELCSRELDEGDLFGIRAIESGYYGGVTQSRPTSAAGSHSLSGSLNRTLVGSQTSPKVVSTSPSSSVIALPLEPKRSRSPLSKYLVSQADDVGDEFSSKRRKPSPLRSRLQPSSAELSGRTRHDPAVDMSLTVPPSPTNDTSPFSELSDENTELGSSSSPVLTQQSTDHYISDSAPQLTLPDDVSGSVRAVSAPYNPYDNKLQRGWSLNRQPVSARSTSPYTTILDLPSVPPRTARAQRSGPRIWHERLSRRDGEPDSILHRPRGSSVSPPRPPRVVSAVGDWGAAVFQEIDKDFHNQAEVPEYLQRQQHQRDISLASSFYSVVDGGPGSSTVEQCKRQVSIDSAFSWEIATSHPSTHDGSGLKDPSNSRRSY